MAFASAPTLTVGGAPRVNLLPRTVVERRERAGLLRKWGWGFVAVLAVVAIGTAGVFTLLTAASVRLAAANAHTNELLIQVAALQPVSQKLQLESELGDFRTQAMGTDLKWGGLLETVKDVLPADVGISEYSLAPGGLPHTEDPTTEAGASGSIHFISATPTDFVALIREVRQLPGVLDADGWATTLSGDAYDYELRVTFDQTVYTGTYAAEAQQ
ncbi:hypothetical protein [Microbacterium invictum]|uniref:Tfp pilus assembly protein PilN n=1 Tax=Microbacterium invictum TaxID=515415 RepID=A0AA40VLI8_9MICO|nr:MULTISPECIES: hypothetical protein [Microbacterium]MBB4139424.1 hypothetical protein [Microbacterium invictum]